ncbi:bifunctional copper resistance protein CopD/cytochrome c oxidase assembly protein [Myceligenerans sp. I2]|uniref:Bifunctional copper resistance protein CopD/cytochrome c oxidase assembly protein n=1 Tax=Myceligenerans indicum TaxID=2593663 RepID=A0ABS1LIK7_9MICO|nr:bifunctional copper resistance protein CopD/cytochrome c oxidase assembly protein [Myceligenerans indicum]
MAAAVAVALAALGAAGSFSGAFAAFQQFADPGVLARWGTPAAQTLSNLSAAVTAGSLVLAAFVLPAGRDARRALGIAGLAAGVWTVTALAALVLGTSWATFLPMSDPAFGTALWSYLTDGEVGRALLGAALLAALTSTTALLVRGPSGAAVALALVIGALGLQASTGHASGASSHDLAVSAMFVHLVGAAIWLGGLIGIALLGHRATTRAATVRRYSAIAGWCFAAVAVSGVVSAWIRLGSLKALDTDYGTLLITKAVLLATLGGAGWLHRSNVVRHLEGVERLDGGSRRAAGLFWRLAAVELLVMGAVSGVAVALGSTAPPVPDDPISDPTPAELVTGHPLPPEPTFTRWVTEFQWDVLFAFGCAAGVVVYLTWYRRLRKRGDRWPLARVVSWCCGMVAMFWVTNGGAAAYGHVLFSGHMVQHMVLAMVVPLFLVLSAPVTLLLRAVPPRKDGSRGPREWVLFLVHSRYGTFIANPIVAAVLFAGGMILFYFTPLFEWALTSYVGHVWMFVHFTLVGYLFANALIGIDPGPSRPTYPMRLVLLFATMAFHAFFGVTLTTGTALLVPEWFGLMGRDWGPSAIVDQQRGGAVAWGIGELPTLLLAIGVAVQWSQSDAREARRSDRAAERDGDAELEAYNAMLARRAERSQRSN